MRYLVLSDIHANLDALDRVLADADRHGDLQLLLLGDLVGYGAEPNAVIDRAARSARRRRDPRQPRQAPRAASTTGRTSTTTARASAAVTGRHADRPQPRVPQGARRRARSRSARSLEICHGTPFDEDAYVFDEMDAVYALRAASRPLCLFGHTHAPFAARLRGEDLAFLDVAPGTPSPSQMASACW